MRLKDKILKHPAVQGIEKDDDEWGYWCYLKTTYVYPEMDCALIHEQTLTEILNCLKYVKKRS
jgi:hypothetical protein